MSSDIPATATRTPRRSLALAALCLYAVMLAGDAGYHLQGLHHGIRFPDLSVAFAAGLFWPADLLVGAAMRYADRTAELASASLHTH